MTKLAISPESIDADAQKVIRRLVRNGYEAYLVGGCVRDLLLGRTPKDFDLATSATPAEVRDLFRNCRIIGRRFRLAHVFFGQKIIETATFRANPREVLGEEGEDEELLIQRDNVFGTAEEDARRRDFTINGLFYDLELGQVIDYVGGQKDLIGRSVRTIGDPDIRFREDPVRILRALKFAARLGFDIEDATYRAIIAHREEIVKSAPPRVLEEIYRLLRGGAALESVLLMRETGLLSILIPDVEKRLERDPVALDPYLRAVDQTVVWGETPSNAVMLVLLMAGELAPLFDERSERLRAPDALVEGVLGPLVERMRVTRRDAERAKLLLLSQRRVWQLRRRAGGKSASLLSRDWFQDAILAHVIYQMALGMGPQEAAAELHALRHGHPPAPAQAGSGSRSGAGPGPGLGLGPGPGPGDGEAQQEEEGPSRRRRRGRRRPERGRDPGAAGQKDGADADDEPVENEDAALDAYAAALNDIRYDD
jgi:poly(A) polymerase